MANKFDLIKDDVVRRVVKYLYNKYDKMDKLSICSTDYDIVGYLLGVGVTKIPGILREIYIELRETDAATFTEEELNEIRRIYPEIFTKKFEYKLLEISSVFIKDYLTEQGELGWELCTIYNNQLIFKREVIPQNL